MLAYGKHNIGLCWGQRPPNWAFGPLFGPLAHFWAVEDPRGSRFKKFVYPKFKNSSTKVEDI